MKLMRENGIDDGHVINLSSMAGHRVLPNQETHFYSATKYAVTALTIGEYSHFPRYASVLEKTSSEARWLLLVYQMKLKVGILSDENFAYFC